MVGVTSRGAMKFFQGAKLNIIKFISNNKKKNHNLNLIQQNYTLHSFIVLINYYEHFFFFRISFYIQVT